MDNYKVSNYEYCRNVEKIPTRSPNVIKAYIPKYMPNIREGNWKQRISINSNLFINASDCALNIPNIVTTQGYCTVRSYPNEKLDFSSKYDEELEYIHIGNRFLVEVMYEDPETVKLTGKV